MLCSRYYDFASHVSVYPTTTHRDLGASFFMGRNESHSAAYGQTHRVIISRVGIYARKRNIPKHTADMHCQGPDKVCRSSNT